MKKSLNSTELRHKRKTMDFRRASAREISLKGIRRRNHSIRLYMLDVLENLLSEVRRLLFEKNGEVSTIKIDHKRFLVWLSSSQLLHESVSHIYSLYAPDLLGKCSVLGMYGFKSLLHCMTYFEKVCYSKKYTN